MTTTQKTYTDKQAAFLKVLLNETSDGIRSTMDYAGYGQTTKTAEAVGSLNEEITEHASMMLARNAPKAALNDASSLGAKNAILAAHELLDRSSLMKKKQIEVINTGEEILFYFTRLVNRTKVSNNFVTSRQKSNWALVSFKIWLRKQRNNNAKYFNCGKNLKGFKTWTEMAKSFEGEMSDEVAKLIQAGVNPDETEVYVMMDIPGPEFIKTVLSKSCRCKKKWRRWRRCFNNHC